MKPIPVRHLDEKHSLQHSMGRFSIRDLQPMTTDKGIVHELHKHDFYFVLFIWNGKGLHEIDFVPHEVHDHAVFILRPGQVHQLRLEAGSTGFLMEFDTAFYQPKDTITDRRWKKASAKNYCPVQAGNSQQLYELLAQIHDEFTLKQDAYIEAIRARLDLFFIGYVRQSSNPQQLNTPERVYAQERFDELLQLIETNISRFKSVADYTALMNLSSYQLNAITKATVGKTVSDLINEQLILEAKRQLLSTSSQVKDIADYLGYEDISYFIRFFKRHTGHSPEAFRKNFT